jgi:hypothetical protein
MVTDRGQGADYGLCQRNADDDLATAAETQRRPHESGGDDGQQGGDDHDAEHRPPRQASKQPNVERTRFDHDDRRDDAHHVRKM